LNPNLKIPQGPKKGGGEGVGGHCLPRHRKGKAGEKKILPSTRNSRQKEKRNTEMNFGEPKKMSRGGGNLAETENPGEGEKAWDIKIKSTKTLETEKGTRRREKRKIFDER